MSADFTPTRGTYRDLTPFRFWCQKVLPLVYDESLSYYEVLCKVVDYLNKTMEDVGTLNDDVTGLYSAYEQLQEYVNTYFDNLDVQEEINQKLDEMAEDGTLTALVDPLLPAIVTAWLEEHIDPSSGYALDNTLTVAGAAADAKAVGDRALLMYPATLSDAWIESTGINDALNLPKNAFFVLQNITEGNLMHMPVTGANYNGMLIKCDNIVGAFTTYFYVNNLGKLWSGISTGTTIRWMEYLNDADVTTEIEEAMQKALVYAEATVTDSWLAANNITDIRQLTKNRVYIFSGVSAGTLENAPYSGQLNGALIYPNQWINAFLPLIFINNTGLLYSGIDTGTTIRWIRTGNGAAIDAEFGNYLRKADHQITDAWLSDNNYNDLRSIPKNRVYIVGNVTAANIANMPPVFTEKANGALIYPDQVTAAFLPLIFIDNIGCVYTGIDTGSAIRWFNPWYHDLYKVFRVGYQKTITLLGDSITYGNHMSDYAQGDRTVITIDGVTWKENTSTTVWSALFKQYMSDNYVNTVVNNSWPGANLQQIAANIATLIAPGTTYCILQAGINNTSTGGQVMPSIKTIADYCAAHNVQLIVLTPFPSVNYAGTMGFIRGFIKNICCERGIPIGDPYTEMMNLMFARNVQLSSLIMDGVHYNDTAQPYLNRAVLSALHM